METKCYFTILITIDLKNLPLLKKRTMVILGNGSKLIRNRWKGINHKRYLNFGKRNQHFEIRINE